MNTEVIQTRQGKTITDLLHTVQRYHPKADLALLYRAYTFAKDAHEGQLRKSGEPYIVHPLSAAMTLAKMGLDEQTIAAGLLHDVPEDTDRTLADVEHLFGKEIAFLVEGITKLGALKYRGIDRYVENLRRMVVAMAQDVRVILIKFADRIHNLETLHALPPEKARRIALESLEIYAPIANRLGMGEMKGRLEDLSFPFVYPEEYQWLVHEIMPHFKQKQEFIDQFKRYIEQEFQKHGIHYLSIHGRKKHIYSLYQKLLRYNRDLTKIYDFVALRVIVDNVAKCYESLGIIHELCKPLKGRIKDYIAQPKPNGYQSLHTTVFSPSQFSKDDVYGEIIEIQIRTLEMHEEAEFGIAAHWKYKEGPDGKIQLDKKLNWMQEIVSLQEEGVTSGMQLLESLKIDIFQNFIFVFTPRGDVIELPEDSTPVDFAYKIHTELGDKCSGVKINDLMGSLDQKLKSGDVVEIVIDPHRKGPSADWLTFVKTSGARHHIRNHIQKKTRNIISQVK